ncbi:MAG: DUF4870 domain-containing protein [Methylacidiphilales bacterium]|nr:DUF4870 domain-containing protein [Candidatus Methylacidiphilales bacterium]
MTTPPPASGPAHGNDKLFIILCHLSLIIGFPFLLPFIVYLAKRNESELVAAHAKEALNFHISLLIYTLCCIPLCFILIGFLMLAVLGLMAFICAIVASIQASDGRFYRYPLTIRLIS